MHTHTHTHKDLLLQPKLLISFKQTSNNTFLMGNRVGLYRHEERGERTGARFGVGLCGLTVVGSILQFFITVIGGWLSSLHF